MINEFINKWQNHGDELSDTQTFWLELLHDILGVENPGEFIEFQKRVELSHVSFIDGYIPSTRIVIEQKSFDVDLTKSYKQSDGSSMTPYEQAKRYHDWLPASQQGRFIITCDFQSFRVHDLEFPRDEPEVILLVNLEKEIERLKFIVNVNAPTPKEIREQELSELAGKLTRKFYDCIKPRYANFNTPRAKRSLNILCTRLVFLLYAEDSGLFPKNAFHDYILSRRNTARDALIKLFDVLNQEKHERDPYLDDDLKSFDYVNGGLFAEKDIEIPRLDYPDDEPLRIILEEMSEGFNWSGINPTIFGAIFESTLNDETREEGGMHYTAIENIHKVINPLFMTELNNEFEKILALPKKPDRTKKLLALQSKLASLTFLDPACGSGNFLTESYIQLRRLENRILAYFTNNQISFAEGEFTPIKVSIANFYGIEINDFAVSVARTALWIAEHQMMKETKSILDIKDDFLPLKTYNHIIEDNALNLSWENLIPPANLNYIISNPPFRGARIMTPDQKNELKRIFSGVSGLANLDYVACWYKKAHDFIRGTQIHAALVSTNSISQGDNAQILWKPLFDEGLNINFAYSPFKWDSKAENKAHVHCVIVGFMSGKPEKRYFYSVNDDGSVSQREARNINAYLSDAPNIFILNRPLPLFDVPLMRIGNKPIDGGFYLFTPEEYSEFIKIEPRAEKYFHLWYGGYEFLHNCPRYCLYLADCTPHEIKSMPECYKRVEAVRKYRLESKSEPTKKLADTPTKFHVTTLPKGKYIAIPKTSSEKRMYIPMGFMDNSVMCADSLRIIPDATLYHFGVLESLPHMGWVRRISGRLEMRYSYSNGIDYNSFVWPEASEKQRAKIERSAQRILDARAKWPDSSLAELYDETLMPSELRRAHRENDRAVSEAYGFGEGMSEFEIVNELMRRYEELTKGE
ncbi:MAG: class I SAM-dependent DNA methyltransferase [Synergistaceae bacterium]|nr:class I SAM-dependent DNA methyltransferase [Synergistaceae bacterium]